MKQEVEDMERNGKWLIGAVALAATATASAQGYFSFDSIPGLGEPNVQIDLPPALLSFVNEAAKGAEPEIANALAGVQNVRVRVYEDVGDNMAAVNKFVEDTSATLERDGWLSAVRVRQDGENVRVYMKPTTNAAAPPGTLDGLTVMVTDDTGDEAVFINIAGAIQPAELGKLANAAGMGSVFNVTGTTTPPPGGAPRPAPGQDQ
jgi:hypothetical protein